MAPPHPLSPEPATLPPRPIPRRTLCTRSVRRTPQGADLAHKVDQPPGRGRRTTEPLGEARPTQPGRQSPGALCAPDPYAGHRRVRIWRTKSTNPPAEAAGQPSPWARPAPPSPAPVSRRTLCTRSVRRTPQGADLAHKVDQAPGEARRSSERPGATPPELPGYGSQHRPARAAVSWVGPSVGGLRHRILRGRPTSSWVNPWAWTCRRAALQRSGRARACGSRAGLGHAALGRGSGMRL